MPVIAVGVAGIVASPTTLGGVSLFAVQSNLMLALTLMLFVVKAFALVDALSRPADAYLAADKHTKNLWLVLLGLAVAAHALLWGPLGLLNLAGTVAALVYLADVRPAVRTMTPRRR